MPSHRIDELLHKMQQLQAEVESEIEALLAEKQAEFRYNLERGKVRFAEDVKALHKRYREDLLPYLLHARPAHVLTAPIIYSVIFPLLLLDLMVTFYQHTCFRIYGIPRVKRGDFIVIDRHHLAYLNAIEKLNCVYCGYGNGLVEYTREIIARTEQYWCPIKHARRNYRRRLKELRHRFGREE